MINFFYFNKLNNSFSLSGIKFDYAPLFLKKHNLKIKELLTMKNNWEYSLLNKNEDRNFDFKKGDSTTINWIMEENELNPIFMANIEFLNGGGLSFSIDNLFVQYPKEMDLKKDLADTLKIIGYFAAEDIIKFAENNVGDHNIGGLFGKNSEEIDYRIFDDIKRATIELENRYKDIEY